MDFNKYYEDRQKLVNTFLEKRLEKKGISRVDEAMAYSLLAGGQAYPSHNFNGNSRCFGCRRL